MHFDLIETERLYLRKLSSEVYEHILRHCTDAFIMQTLNIAADEVAREKEKAQKGFSTYNKDLLIFQLIYKETDEIIGWCGFHTWYTDHNRAELGYMLTQEGMKAKGLMSEAMTRVIDYGFTQMQLCRIEALIGPGNVPSLRLAKKFGFTKEGQMRNHYLKNGRYEDSVVFGLLAETYKNRDKNKSGANLADEEDLPGAVSPSAGPYSFNINISTL